MSFPTPQGGFPCRELVEILLPAFAPCERFRGSCQTMRWRPEQGHMPRGFCGATGTLSEVEVVFIVAEPGDPHSSEAYEADASPYEKLSCVFQYVYQCFETGHDQFHRNVRDILGSCWPNLVFHDQMRRVWITESSLCSAAREGGHVPISVHRQCREQYLKRQLALLSDRIVVALGRKAQYRVGRIEGVLNAASVAPPGCNFKGARQSWERVAEVVRMRRRENGAR
jgi:hypothetical protein